MRFSLLALILLVFLNFSRAQGIDLLLKGGYVIDPKNGINSIMDVAIVDGKIQQVASNIPEDQSKKSDQCGGSICHTRAH